MIWKKLVRCGLVLLGALPPVSAQAECLSPLQVSDDRRRIERKDGFPFFWTGDTAWRLERIAPDGVDLYLGTRAAQGFNIIQGPLLTHDEADNHYGQRNTDPAQPNEAFFTYIDTIIEKAAEHCLYIAPVVTWSNSVQSNGKYPRLFDDIETAYEYGRWLARRYRHDHVVWIVSGEYNFFAAPSHHDRSIYDAIGRGLREGSGGRNLITIHGGTAASSSEWFHEASWLDFNMIQSAQHGDDGRGHDNYRLVEVDYRLRPVKPTLDAEATYEGVPWAIWGDEGVRRRAYWSVFAGGFGHTYGHWRVWQFEEGWEALLHTPGAEDMRHLKALMLSRPHGRPADDLIGNNPGPPHHMKALRHPRGDYSMVYVPRGNGGLRINNPAEPEMITAWWFNPRDGTSKVIGTFASLDHLFFTSPDEAEDWVLVLDDAELRADTIVGSEPGKPSRRSGD